MRAPLSVGVVGLDPRGVELAARFAALGPSELRWVCDERRELRMRIGTGFGAGARTTATVDDLLQDEGLEAIVITGGDRACLARRALEADKHVFVDRPLARSSQAAEALVRLAAARSRALVVSDPLAAQAPVRKLKELVETGGLGGLFYTYANQQGVGCSAGPTDLLWEYGADDVALILYLVDDEPIEVAVHAESYLDAAIPDVIFCYLRFATGITSHLHLSSALDPHRLRRMTAVGSKGMAVFDDGVEPDRKLTIYKHAPVRTGDASADVAVGDIHVPRIESSGAVRLECERLIDAARGATDRPGLRRALSVVRVLELLQAALERDVLARAPAEPPARAADVIQLRPRSA